MRKTRILFCDDEEITRQRYQKSFKKNWPKCFKKDVDFEVCEDIVESRTTFPKMSLSDIGNFDVLLLDIMWGDCIPHGVNIAEMVRKKYPELPIVIFSGRARLEDFKKLIPLGISAYLSKTERDAKSWCYSVDNVLRRAYEDRAGQSLYKQLRELSVKQGAWLAETIDEAASEVWRKESSFTKWNDFWETMTPKIARRDIYPTFKDMTKLFSDSELVNLGVLPSMRGHLEHVLYVYFTGYVLTHKIPRMKEFVLNAVKNLLGKGFHSNEKTKYWDLFQFSWLSCATLHDTGYSLESLPDIFSKYLETKERFPFAKIDDRGSKINDISISWESEESKFVQKAFQFIIGRLHHPHIDSNWIYGNAIFEDTKNNIKRFNHGVASGLLFLQKIYNLMGQLKNKQDLQIFLKWAATAMALHSLKIVGEEQGVSISFENDPLSFLLVLCDELQIWNRERPDASCDSSIFRSTDLEYLNIDNNKIEAVLRYMPYRGMELSKKKHVSPLIDKISEDSIRLSKFLKSQPLSIQIKNYIQGLEDIELPEINLE